MKTGSITYNGKNSLTDLGIYVTGSGSFDAAELDVDKYQVAGRNGDIIISKNRYKNISISYPAFIPMGFENKAQSVRNWLRSAKGYSRLEDTYDMNHFRLGLATGIQSFEPVNRNDGSNFQMTFDCKPQRFLKTGETESKVEVDSHSYTGDIVSFNTIAEDDLTTLKSSILPVQSGSGDPSPNNIRPISGWTGANFYDDPKHGGGIEWNQLIKNGNFADSSGWLVAGGTASFSSNTMTITATASSYYIRTSFASQSGHKYLVSFDIKGGKDNMTGGYAMLSWSSGGNISTGVVNKAWKRFEAILSLTANGTLFAIYGDASAGTVGDSITVKNINIFDLTAMFGAGNEPATVEAFRELFPLEFYAYDSGTQTCVSAVNGDPYRHLAFSFGQTVYGGELDANTGEVTETWGNIASYAGETLTGEWISDRDVYTSGGTPTTGAQVVYELASPQSISVTPQSLSTLVGENNLWSDCGQVTVGYADPFSITNPTEEEARPLFRLVNPAQNDVITLNGKTITISTSYTGEMFIDCETMDAFSSSGTNLNSYITATDFPVLVEGLNIVTWSGTGDLYITPRWWEL